MIVEELLPHTHDTAQPNDEARARQIAERNRANLRAFYCKVFGDAMGPTMELLDHLRDIGVPVKLAGLVGRGGDSEG